MSNKKISIIVPVYNVEKYLNICIKSLVGQTYKNLEIILVDDDSPDNCPQICDEWAKKDKRIKVIHKKNEGLGFARNSGMNISTGDYICFVDSDDFIEINTIEKCVEKINEYAFDIIYYGHDKYDGNSSIKKYIPNPPRLEYYDNKLINEELLPALIIDIPGSNKINMILSACMCLIKSSTIKNNKWRFVSERKIISEDIYSMFKLIKNINSIAIIDEIFYHYRVNNSSLTHTYRNDRFDKIKHLYSELVKLSDDKACFKERINYLFLSYTISCLKSIVSSNIKYSIKINEIKNMINDAQFRKIIKLYWKKESFIRKIYFLFVILKSKHAIYFLTFIQSKR